MCIIVDANRSHLFGSPIHQDFRPVFEWVQKRDGKLVYGGRLVRELFRRGETRRLLIQWDRAGRAIRFPDDALANEERRVAKLGLMKSNDTHVIALAIISRARTLFTDENNLVADFKNGELINKPRGSVYRNASHKRLLKHTNGCPGDLVAKKKRRHTKTKRK